MGTTSKFKLIIAVHGDWPSLAGKAQLVNSQAQEKFELASPFMGYLKCCRPSLTSTQYRTRRVLNFNPKLCEIWANILVALHISNVHKFRKWWIIQNKERRKLVVSSNPKWQGRPSSGVEWKTKDPYQLLTLYVSILIFIFLFLWF